MIRILAIILLTSLGQFAWSQNIPLKIIPKQPKISTRFEEKINQSSGNLSFNIWVFFTDKGIFDEPAYKQTLSGLAGYFSERAINRRQNRSDLKGLDFYDIPVYHRYTEQLEQIGLKIATQSRWLNAVSGQADRSIIEKISQLPFVAEIRPVATAIRKPIPDESFKIHDNTPSADSIYGFSYTQLNQINAIKMHKLGYTGKGVLIALFDTGFRVTHPALDSIKVIAQYDFINNDITVDDSEIAISEPDHGTKTLSAIGGYASGELIGAAYGAEYILGKTEKNYTEDTTEENNWVEAAEWVDSIGADIISSSLGYLDWYTYQDLDGETAVITIAADIAVQRGIAVFNSAGNERDDPFYYIIPPADGKYVMAVGAVNSLGDIAAFSSAGPTFDGRIKPDIVAMGVGVRVADYGGGYVNSNGTSFSAPLAAGAAALILEAHPDWSPMELREAMIKSADRYANPDNLYGYGLIDTYKAANIFRINPIAPIAVVVGDSLNLQVTTIEGDDTNIVFTAIGLPSSAIFTSDGKLSYLGKEEDIGTRKVMFMASYNGMADTAEALFSVIPKSDMTLGPNPFRDSVNIYIGPNSGNAQNISIHEVNGEKVWEITADKLNGMGAVVTWHGINHLGQKTAPGVYLIVVRTDRLTEKFKVLMK